MQKGFLVTRSSLSDDVGPCITADRPENTATVVAGMEINPSSSDECWNIRSQDYLFPGGWNIRSHDGTFVLRTIRSLEHSFPGPFVPWNIRSQELSFPGPFVPWTIRSRERILRGKFIPLTTTVAIHRSLCT